MGVSILRVLWRGVPGLAASRDSIEQSMNLNRRSRAACPGFET
jgi:hypothetical protein